MGTEKRLIDAYKLNDVLQNMAEHLLESGDSMIAAHLLYCQEVVDQQPTVDAVEVVHGRWIADTPFCCSCSICNHTRGGLAHEDGQNYCPNCGAKMDGGADNG